MYTDYEFYTNEYYGDKIPEDEFAKYESNASDFLNFACSDSLKSNLPTRQDPLKKIKKAVCAVADALYSIDARKKEIALMGTGAIKSISSGGESITYQSSILDSIVIGDYNTRNKYLYNAMYQYMSGVCDKNGRLYIYEGI